MLAYLLTFTSANLFAGVPATVTLSPVAISSNNANAAFAKSGDVVTLTFTASEPIQIPVVTLLGESGTITNPSGNDWSITVTVGATTLEGLATFSITATALVGGGVGSATATTDASGVTVDRTAPTLTLPANITRGATSAAGATVTYTASAAGATTSSFVPASGSVFPLGVTTVNATASDAAGNTTTGSFTITVNPGVSIAAASVVEGNSGTVTVNLPVSRTDSTTAFTVNYAVSGGTATAGTDFTFTAGTLTFNVGDGTQYITITVNGDTIVESAETVSITLSGLVNVTGITTIATASASGTITNDDTIPVVFPAANTFTSTVKGSIPLAGAEIPAFDPISKRAFASSNVGIQVVDLTDPAVPTLITTITPATLGVAGITSNDVTSIAVRKGAGANPSVLAAAILMNPKTDLGYVVFLNAADGTLLGSVQVGANPDNLSFTPDGTKVLVANEGETEGGLLGNADLALDTTLGTVSIIDVSGGFAAPTVTTADFTAYDSQVAALRAAGVRIFKNSAGVDAIPSRDFEPEYVAIAPDGLTAMVTLQEANAVAILDIATATFTSIKALGKKDYSTLRVDFSDRDGPGAVALINPTVGNPVFGLYMPDSIASYSAGGQTYYVTANEGDDRNGFINPDETTTVGAVGYVLDPTVFPNAAALKNVASLGRLTVSNAPGLRGDTDNDGDVDEILSYGGRSFSILDAAGNEVFDSGEMIDLIVMSQHFSNFDDGRSDNKGAEPEGVTIATLGSQTYAFIGLERSHMVMMFDITNPAAPTYTTSFKRTGDLNPEGLVVVQAADSPNGKPLLITASENSNTLSVFEINDPAGPVLTLPANIVAEATSAAGATISYTATATDAASGIATSSFAPASGSVFPLGVTTVIASATDNAGNTSDGSFTVTVQDTTAPSIGGTFTPLSINEGDTLADYTTQAITSDVVGVTSITQSPAAGTTPAPGIVSVTLTAHDAAGNTADVSFSVTVVRLHPAITAIAAKNAPVPGAGVVGSGIPAGAVWIAFGVPSIDDAGQAAVLATYKVGTVNTVAILGWNSADMAGSMKAIVKWGDAAPGITNAIQIGFKEPLLAPDGSVAWIATLGNAPATTGAVVATSNTAIVVDADGTGTGTATIIARKGAVAVAPTVWSGFTSVALGANAVAFTATLSGATPTTDVGLWVYDRGTSSLALALREGDALLGSTVKSFAALVARTGTPGQGRGVAFDSEEDRAVARVTLADNRQALGIIHQDASSTFNYVAAADAVGYGTGAKWQSFGLPTQNSASAAKAFVGTVKDKTGTATTLNNVAIFAEDDATHTAARIVSKGDATGVSGGVFSTLRDPASAGNQRVAFIATIKGNPLAGITAANDAGIWHRDNSLLSLVAREGAQPAEAPVGAQWKAFTSLALPEGNGPIFVATMHSKIGTVSPGPGGITAANDTGLWATDSFGALRLLLQEGDAIGTSTVQSFVALSSVLGSPAQTLSFNNNGSILVRATDATGVGHLLLITVP